MKSTWKTIVIYALVLIAISIFIFFFVQSYLSHRWGAKYDKLNNEFNAKNQEYINFKAAAEKEKAELQAGRDKEKQKRDELDVKIAGLESEKKSLAKNLEQEKKKTKTLSPDDLAKKLNERVPNEYGLLQTGDFHLTRAGGERTLNLFLDGENYFANYNKQLEINKVNEGKVSSLEESLKKAEKEIMLSDETLKKCDESLKACDNAKKALEKSYRAMKWRSRFQGAVGGSVLTVVVLKILGTI